MLSSCASRIHFRAARFVKQFACHSLQIWEISFASVVTIVLVVVSRGYVTIIFCIALARFQIIFGNISLSLYLLLRHMLCMYLIPQMLRLNAILNALRFHFAQKLYYYQNKSLSLRWKMSYIRLLNMYF